MNISKFYFFTFIWFVIYNLSFIRTNMKVYIKSFFCSFSDSMRYMNQL